MTDREKILELLKGAERKVKEQLTEPLSLGEWLDIYADHLIENGVIVPPCKVGDTVYVIFSNFYAEYKVIKFLYDGAFVWAKLVNEEYEPQDREILRCISFDINKTIFLNENEASLKIKGV